MAMCSGVRLALLVYGLIMHSSVYCSPAATGLRFPGIRPEEEAYNADGDALQDWSESDPPGDGSPASVLRAGQALYYSAAESRDAALGTLDKAYRRVLDWMSARKYLQALEAKGAGGNQGGSEDDWEPLSKRHSDGIFTDSYSRYRKQMAVKKYLAAVLGKRPEDINADHLLLYINNDAVLQGDLEDFQGRGHGGQALKKHALLKVTIKQTTKPNTDPMETRHQQLRRLEFLVKTD